MDIRKITALAAAAAAAASVFTACSLSKKNRLEKTIAQLTQRLEYVEESLANM